MFEFSNPKYLGAVYICPHCHSSCQMVWTYHLPPKTLESPEVSIAYCVGCEKPNIWVDEQLIYPDAPGIAPNEDMPEGSKQLFIEAQSVIGKSPRASCMLLRLCIETLLTELGYKQEKLVQKIEAVSKDYPSIQKALTACRKNGNKFVHDFLPNDEVSDESNGIDNLTAASLMSNVINFIVDTIVTQEKNINMLFAYAAQR